jgi:CO dehydrogenase maturation factor
MTKLYGFIGKGGTGKSTLAALFLKYFLDMKLSPILVIDSDPNENLGELLELNVDSTIGSIRQELMKRKNNNSGDSVSKYDYCEYALNNSIIESKGFDLLVMGRPDGPGCYCMINNVITAMIEKLRAKYKMVIVDCEAGLEHISRKTLGDIDTAFIVSDFSRKGILTGVRQSGMMRELGIKSEKKYLIINNVSERESLEDLKILLGIIGEREPEFAGIVRRDENISEYERNSRSLLGIPEDSVSYIDMKSLLLKLQIKF